MQMQHYTGLEISHEPGQWGIWAGVLLMGFGLGVAFYMVHIRFWIMPVTTKEGKLALWVGGASNKNKDRFEEKYQELLAAIRQELGINQQPAAAEQGGAGDPGSPLESSAACAALLACFFRSSSSE